MIWLIAASSFSMTMRGTSFRRFSIGHPEIYLGCGR